MHTLPGPAAVPHFVYLMYSLHFSISLIFRFFNVHQTSLDLAPPMDASILLHLISHALFLLFSFFTLFLTYRFFFVFLYLLKYVFPIYLLLKFCSEPMYSILFIFSSILPSVLDAIVCKVFLMFSYSGSFYGGQINNFPSTVFL